MLHPFIPNPLLEKKVWFNERGGFIYKSTLDPISGKIYQEKIPYNQPSNFTNFLYRYRMTHSLYPFSK